MKVLDNENKNLKKFIIILLVFIGIGFASLSTTIGFKGLISVKPNDWDVHFDNLVVSKDSMIPLNEATIDDGQMQISFDLELTKPGEYYEFEVDIVNEGTINTRISSITLDNFTETEEKYLDYTIEYVEGNEISIGDIIKSQDKVRIRFKLEFLYDIKDTDIPTEGSINNFKLNLKFVQDKK